MKQQPSFGLEIEDNVLLGIGDCEDTEIIIPDGVISISDSAFEDCGSVTNVTIPKSVISIGDYAFLGCVSLREIEIPCGVILIGEYAFDYCKSLTRIIVDTNNPIFDSRDNCNAIIETKTNKLIVGCKTTIIPESIISIGDYAFSCVSIESIVIPKSVIEIGDCAFEDCTSLINVTIPDGTKRIGSCAFNGCKSLTSIIIPNSVSTIESNAFYRCVSIKIYCEVASKPDGWSSNWNPNNRPLVWGYKYQ